jgi:hypothetical protein
MVKRLSEITRRKEFQKLQGLRDTQSMEARGLELAGDAKQLHDGIEVGFFNLQLVTRHDATAVRD